MFFEFCGYVFLSRKKKSCEKCAATHLAGVGPGRVRRHRAEHGVPLLGPVEAAGRGRDRRGRRRLGLGEGAGRGDGGGCAEKSKRAATKAKRRRVR